MIERICKKYAMTEKGARDYVAAVYLQSIKFYKSFAQSR